MYSLNLAFFIHLAFRVYTLLLMARIIGSWFPQFAQHKIMAFIAFYTDPFLNIFRRFIPPVQGVLDLSPLIAFFALGILEKLFFWILF